MDRWAYFKLVLGKLFTAILGYADLITDILVMLEYGCVIPNALSAGCDNSISAANTTDSTDATNGVSSSCDAHWWWFGLSLTILVISSLAGAFHSAVIPDNGWRAGCGGCMAIFQLTYLSDLLQAIVEPEKSERMAGYLATREIWLKITECVPQLYLQSYVLFAVHAHGDPFKVASTLISAGSLALGILKFMDSFDDFLVDTLPKKAAVGFFLASDQLLRASGYALVLSEGARPIGIPLIILFALVAWRLCFKAEIRNGGLLIAFFLGIFGEHVVPVYNLRERLKNSFADISQNGEQLGSWSWWRTLHYRLSMPLRYLEMALCGLVGLTLAKTACGHTPIVEVMLFFGLMLVNIISLVVVFLCVKCQSQPAPSQESQALEADSPRMTPVGAKYMGKDTE